MFGPDVFVIAAMGFLARFYQRAANAVGKIVAGQKVLLVEAQRFLSAVDIASTCG